ncbi:glycine--tRNA ligase subunit beta, partial [Candidatus Wolfebacteria bacterium]|nr:glycine--tRNA ligase subunit beta [Candidatus Wolfebacteria bacterium]
MKKDIFLEIGVEEIPASYMLPALRQLEEATQKFLNDNEVSFSRIKTLGTPRRLVLFIEGTEAKTKDGIIEAGKLSGFFSKAIPSISFPKSMRWNVFNIRFARPIRWALALYGSDVINFELDGVKSGNVSYGHRFLSPEKFAVADFNQYLSELKNRFVVI